MKSMKNGPAVIQPPTGVRVKVGERRKGAPGYCPGCGDQDSGPFKLLDVDVISIAGLTIGTVRSDGFLPRQAPLATQ